MNESIRRPSSRVIDASGLLETFRSAVSGADWRGPPEPYREVIDHRIEELTGDLGAPTYAGSIVVAEAGGKAFIVDGLSRFVAIAAEVAALVGTSVPKLMDAEWNDFLENLVAQRKQRWRAPGLGVKGAVSRLHSTMITITELGVMTEEEAISAHLLHRHDRPLFEIRNKFSERVHFAETKSAAIHLIGRHKQAWRSLLVAHRDSGGFLGQRGIESLVTLSKATRVIDFGPVHARAVVPKASEGEDLILWVSAALIQRSESGKDETTYLRALRRFRADDHSAGSVVDEVRDSWRRTLREPNERRKKDPEFARGVLLLYELALRRKRHQPPPTPELLSRTTLDHIEPRKHGGTHALGNLTLVERTLNSGMGEKRPRDRALYYSRSDWLQAKELCEKKFPIALWSEGTVMARTEHIISTCRSFLG